MGKTAKGAFAIAAALVLASCSGRTAVLPAHSAATGANTYPNTFSITEHDLPTPDSEPLDIVIGPDGNGWFSEYRGEIGRLTPAGVLTEFPVPSNPQGITVGPDGNIWFTEPNVNRVGRITSLGVVTEFSSGGALPVEIAAGPDGRLWYTLEAHGKIGAMTTEGVVTTFNLHHPGSGPWSITSGPDGNLWFTEEAENRIGRITTSGVISEFAVTTSPEFITTGPYGSLWFTEINASKIGRITTWGKITEFSTARRVDYPTSIVSSRSELWFTESHTQANNVSSMTVSGKVVHHSVPTRNSEPYGIAASSDGTLWFTEFQGNKIGIITR